MPDPRARIAQIIHETAEFGTGDDTDSIAIEAAARIADEFGLDRGGPQQPGHD